MENLVEQIENLNPEQMETLCIQLTRDKQLKLMEVLKRNNPLLFVASDEGRDLNDVFAE